MQSRFRCILYVLIVGLCLCFGGKIPVFGKGLLVRIPYVQFVSHATFCWVTERRDLRNLSRAASADVRSGAKLVDALGTEPIIVRAGTTCVFLLLEPDI